MGECMVGCKVWKKFWVWMIVKLDNWFCIKKKK